MPELTTSSSSTSNPSPRALLLLKITTTLSYLLLIVTTFYYAFHRPEATHHPNGRFWQHNISTPFAQSSWVTSIYWLLLFVLQLYYLWSLYSSSEPHVSASAAVGPHFVASNLLLFAFVHLWVRGFYWLALLLVVVNFFNLSLNYFRHSTTPRFIHVGAVSGPLAWNFAALYWVGAVAVRSNHLAARIVANVFIWGWGGYGVFFLAAYKDYSMGLGLAWMAFSTGLGQLLTSPHILQLQYIFAFTISGLLFLLSIAVGVPGLLGGREPFPRGQIVSEDQERAPLLADD